MYYGLFVKVNRNYVRVDTTTGFTLETAKRQFAPLIATLVLSGLVPELRKLPPVKLVDARAADRKYARTPW